MATPTLLCDSLGSLVIYVGSAVTPADTDWQNYLATIHASAGKGHSGVRVAVFADGEPPTATQRKSIAELGRNQQHKSAVISDSLAARAVVTGLRWMGLEIRPFSPRAIEEAFIYLELTLNERSWLVATERGFRLRLAARRSLRP
jgi:hypothetical protein